MEVNERRAIAAKSGATPNITNDIVIIGRTLSCDSECLKSVLKSLLTFVSTNFTSFDLLICPNL